MIRGRHRLTRRSLLDARADTYTLTSRTLTLVHTIFYFTPATEWINQYLVMLLFMLISVVVPLVSFACYVKLQGEDLTVAVAFTSLSYFAMYVYAFSLKSSIVRSADVGIGMGRREEHQEIQLDDTRKLMCYVYRVRGPLNQIPDFGIRLLQTKISIARIESFFAEEEVASHATPLQRSSSSKTLSVNDATFRYSKTEEGAFEFADISIPFPEGQLTLVSGPTGSGKTSRELIPSRRMTTTDSLPSCSPTGASRRARSPLGFGRSPRYGLVRCSASMARVFFYPRINVRRLCALSALAC